MRFRGLGAPGGPSSLTSMRPIPRSRGREGTRSSTIRQLITASFCKCRLTGRPSTSARREGFATNRSEATGVRTRANS